MSTTNADIVRTEQLFIITNQGKYFFPAIYLNKPIEMDISIDNYPELANKIVSFHSYGNTLQSMEAFCAFEIDNFYSTYQENGQIVYTTTTFTNDGTARSDSWPVRWPSNNGGVLFLGLVLLIGSDNMCYFYSGINFNTSIVSEYKSNLTIDNYPTSGAFGVAHVNRNITLTGTLTNLFPLDRLPLPPEYQWRSWPQLAGNSGQYLLDLAQIQANMIGQGTPAVTTQDGSIFTLPQQSLYIRICGNLQEGVEQTVMYCGDNFATATRRSSEGTGGIINVYITFKFYFRSGILAYTSTERNGWRENLGTTTQQERYFGIMYDDENEVADMNTIAYSHLSGNYVYNVAALHSDQEMHQLWIWLQDNGETHEHGNPYDTGSEDNGGDPGQPRPQDNIPDSTLPTTSGLELGFVTLYKPTVSQLQSISSFLWSDTVLDNFKKYFNNFADNILSLYVLPFSPASLPTKTFKVGQMTSEVTGVEYCTARYYDVDMGSVQVLPRWDSCLDYNPYTKIQIFLPYLGLHSLDIDEIMSPARMDGTLPAGNGSTLTLKYRLDILTGVIVAKISINGNVKYQFEGKVGASVPLTGQTFASLVQGIVQAGAGLVSTIASGGLTAPLSAAAAVTGTVNASKASVERVGNISGDASLLALDYPYIIISSPNKPMLEQQEDYTGFPSYKSGTIGSFSGYTEVIQAHVEGISCTEEERTMILKWLKEGVII